MQWWTYSASALLRGIVVGLAWPGVPFSTDAALLLSGIGGLDNNGRLMMIGV